MTLTDLEIDVILRAQEGLLSREWFTHYARAIEAAVLSHQGEAGGERSAAFLDILACAVERATPELGDSHAKLASAAAALRTPGALSAPSGEAAGVGEATEERATVTRTMLHKFLDAAAGEGLQLDGVDAADLFCRLFEEGHTP
jgi:hypothetical protein